MLNLVLISFVHLVLAVSVTYIRTSKVKSMRLIADNSGPIPKDEVLSTCYEKEGYYRTLGTEALSVSDVVGREAGFHDADRCYDLALEAESSARRRSKIRAAKTTTAYLAATNARQREVARAQLEALIAEIEKHHIAAGDTSPGRRHSLFLFTTTPT